jgi:hypothetical protein
MRVSYQLPLVGQPNEPAVVHERVTMPVLAFVMT